MKQRHNIAIRYKHNSIYVYPTYSTNTLPVDRNILLLISALYKHNLKEAES